MGDNRALKILQVIPAFKQGGVEKVTFDTMVGLLEQGFGTHHVACAFGTYVPLLPQDITVHDMPLDSKNPFIMVKNAVKLYRLLRCHNITIVHSHSRAPSWSALWACGWARVPLITTYHGAYSAQSWFKKYYNSVMVRGQRVVAISHFMDRYIRAHYPNCQERLVTIPEGIDTTYFDPLNVSQDRIQKVRTMLGMAPKIEAGIGQGTVEGRIFLLPARLTPIKGHDWFLTAMGEMTDFLKANHITVVFLGTAAGKLGYKQTLEDKARHLGIPLVFIDSCDDMPALYRCADVVFSCTLKPETFGRTIAEAIAMERPVIATDHGGAIELTHQGQYGMLIPPGDIRALKEAIVTLMTTQILIGRQHIIQHYSLAHMLEKTKELYSSFG